MLRLIDGHRFVNASPKRMASGDFPTQWELDQRQPVRRVTVNFVGAREDEDRVRTIGARGLQKMEGADRVHSKIYDRRTRRPIVRRLSRRMNDYFDGGSMLPEYGVHAILVADIDRPVAIAWQRLLQLHSGAGGRRFWAEKLRPHVVVNPHNLQ